MKIYLASTSPRRKELFANIVKEFEIKESNFNEDSIKYKSPKMLVKVLSTEKCKAVFDNLNEEVCVIGADTVVCVANQILGKPKDEEDAKKMLKMLSGTSHKVLTGVCVMISDNETQTKINFTTSSTVFFREIGNDEIEEYVKTNEPFGKAGGYAIQGIAGKFVEKINGSFHNIVGLPIAQLYKVLKEEQII